MKVLDDKDLEIARLSGKVEALEAELAKERAVRLMALPQRTTLCAHAARDLNNRCLACGDVARGVTNEPWQILPAAISYKTLNPVCQNGLPVVWTTWSGVPSGVLGPGVAS